MRTRRALSTVVGMAFAIIALSSTFAYISYSMNTLSTYNQSVVQHNQQLADVNKEKFQITSVTFANNKFNITIANTGNLPINFTKLWIQNMSTTNWDHSYVPTNSFVSPGGTVTNIGQSLSGVFYSTKSYNIMLVTTRGNTQQFTVNSASAAPLNIQLLAFPPSVSSGFYSQLTMIVTNNGSSMLTNISPSALPAPSGAATCVPGTVSPSSYNTLAPGGTAVFTWSVKATANNDGDYCKYTFTTPLQGGYAQTVTAQITVNQITFSSTNLAANTGILTINYTNFRWTSSVHTTWQNGWQVDAGKPTAFSIKLTNNNATAGTNLYISKSSVLILFKTGSAASTAWYITQNVTLGSPSITAAQAYKSCPSGTDDWCVNIAPKGSTTLYFATTTATGTTVSTTDNTAAPEAAFILILGKYSTNQGTAGTLYAQNIPFLAVNLQ